jgi:hypothetical protein
METQDILQNGNTLHVVTCYTEQPANLEEATRLTERHFFGAKGVFARQAFDYINATFFDGRLPWTLILWAITPHGGCLGSTRSREHSNEPPIVTLHPSLLGGSESANPWGVSSDLLGVCYAFDVLLHECIHVSVHYLLGGAQGPTSHNNPQWIAEVNRIAPLLGLKVQAERSKVKRIPVEGEPTKHGKQPTTVKRVSEGNIPFKAVSTFPHGVRWYLGCMDFYEHNVLPFALDLKGLAL